MIMWIIIEYANLYVQCKKNIFQIINKRNYKNIIKWDIDHLYILLLKSKNVCFHSSFQNLLR